MFVEAPKPGIIMNVVDCGRQRVLIWEMPAERAVENPQAGKRPEMTTEERLEKLERELSDVKRHSRYMSLALALCLGLLVVLGFLVFYRGNDKPEMTAPLADRYYMIMFSSEDALNLARHSHTFATFIKARGPADGKGEPEVIETYTISWLPKDLKEDLRIVFSKPEPGKNYTLEETLAYARKYNRKVKKWGAFEIPLWLFEKSIQDTTVLESGLILYIAIGTDESHRKAYLGQAGGSKNCIHAVSDLIKFRNVGLNWGSPASRLILKEDFMPHIIHPERTHSKITALLGLDWISNGG